MASGTQTTETALQSFLDGLFGRDDVPAGALHGRSDADADLGPVGGWRTTP